MRIFTFLSTLASLLTGILAYQTLKIYNLRKKYKSIPGPKSSGIIGFYLGQYSLIVKHIASRKILQELHLKWYKKYGPIYAYQVLNNFIVIVNDEQAVKNILIDFDIPKKGIGAFPLGERFLGTGILTQTDKKKWRQRRNLMNHGFKKDILIDSLKEFNIKANEFIERLETLTKTDDSICLFSEINRMTLDVIAKVAFDLDTCTINNPESKLNYYISRGLEAITLEIVDPLCKLKPHKRNLIKQLQSSIRKLRQISIESLTEKLNELKENNFQMNNILSLIIQNSKSGDDFDFDKLVDDFITFFIAGQETTANALAFCFLELGRNPQVFEKLKSEIDSVLENKREVTRDDLSRLEYTSAVFKESMRKWPPVPSFSRYSEKEYEIMGFKIPKNTWFLMPTYIIGRNENYYPQPELFKPERFLKDDSFSNENKINSYTFFPFSLGPRNCIGQNFAKIEGKVILAKFIQSFDFELDQDQSFDVIQHTTLRPLDGVKVFLRKRILS